MDRTRLDICEGQLMQTLPLISGATHMLHKTLSAGYLESSMRGAMMDLRAAATRIEGLIKDWPSKVEG